MLFICLFAYENYVVLRVWYRIDLKCEKGFFDTLIPKVSKPMWPPENPIPKMLRASS